MSDPVRFVAVLPALWLVLVLFGSWLFALAYPAFSLTLRNLSPANRALARLVYGVMTPVAALLVLILLLLPAGAHLVPSHCHAGHCEAHVPAFEAISPALVLTVALIAGIAGIIACALVVRGVRVVARRVRALEALSRPEGSEGFRLIDSQAPLAWCVGLLRPSVLLSRGLWERLGPVELQVVLAHERAHAERRDNLRAFLLHLATRPWPASPREAIRRALARDHEQVCDQFAVRQFGESAPVAAALEAAPRPELKPHGWPTHSHAVRERFNALEVPGADAPVLGPLIACGLLLTAWLLLMTLQLALSHGVVEWLGALHF